MSREVHVRFCERLGHLSPADSTDRVDSAESIGFGLRWNGERAYSNPSTPTV